MKSLRDVDTYEKEDGQFECEVTDPDASVQWFKEGKVKHIPTKCYNLLQKI